MNELVFQLFIVLRHICNYCLTSCTLHLNNNINIRVTDDVWTYGEDETKPIQELLRREDVQEGIVNTSWMATQMTSLQ